MSKDRRWLGREGETRAARFLESRGYRIVARNVRADRVEIDLIACRGSLLAFVEVKSRRANGGARPEPGRGSIVGHGVAAEAVDGRKQSRLRRGAHAWLAANPQLARRTNSRRFDVVTCVLEDAAGSVATAAAGRARLDEPPNETTAPKAARWSIEHWEAAF